MHRACTGEDARLVCLGVSPSPRVRCLLACFTLLYYLYFITEEITFERKAIGERTHASEVPYTKFMTLRLTA